MLLHALAQVLVLNFAQVRRVEITSDGAGDELDSLGLVAAEDELSLTDDLMSEKRRRERKVDEIDAAARSSFQRVREPIHYGVPGVGSQENSDVQITRGSRGAGCHRAKHVGEAHFAELLEDLSNRLQLHDWISVYRARLACG